MKDWINIQSSIDKYFRWRHVRHLDQVSKNSSRIAKFDKMKKIKHKTKK